MVDRGGEVLVVETLIFIPTEEFFHSLGRMGTSNNLKFILNKTNLVKIDNFLL